MLPGSSYRLSTRTLRSFNPPSVMRAETRAQITQMNIPPDFVETFKEDNEELLSLIPPTLFPVDYTYSLLITRGCSSLTPSVQVRFHEINENLLKELLRMTFGHVFVSTRENFPADRRWNDANELLLKKYYGLRGTLLEANNDQDPPTPRRQNTSPFDVEFNDEPWREQ